MEYAVFLAYSQLLQMYGWYPSLFNVIFCLVVKRKSVNNHFDVTTLEGGSQCPAQRQLKEILPCPTMIECAKYTWRVEPWNDCELNQPGKRCGPGTQQRVVNCYSIEGQLVTDKRYISETSVFHFVFVTWDINFCLNPAWIVDLLLTKGKVWYN